MNVEKRALERAIAERETHSETYLEAIGKLVVSAATVTQEIENSEEVDEEKRAISDDLMAEFRSHLFETFENAVRNKTLQLADQQTLDALTD